MSSESLHCLFEASSSMSFFLGMERLSSFCLTGTCHQYWAMWLGHVAKEEGLIQVGKPRIENNQASGTDGYTTNIYNQPDIQINVLWLCICIYIYINHVMDIFVTFLSPNVKGRITQRVTCTRNCQVAIMPGRLLKRRPWAMQRVTERCMAAVPVA